MSPHRHEALEAFQLCTKLEGIIPALEPAHALAACDEDRAEMGKDHLIVMNCAAAATRTSSPSPRRWGASMSGIMSRLVARGGQKENAA
jgi:hypothetical protein